MFKATTRLAQNKMTQYNVQIVSDVVCPWCYIGHAKLSKAIENHKKTYPDDKFNLEYKAFYLNPAPQVYATSGPPPPPFPIESKDRRQMYAEKFGPDRAKQIEAMVTGAAAQAGLNFKFGGKTGPSRNGHRLIHYAKTHGGEDAQNKVMLGLWRRYFEQEIDITTLETLTDVGVEAGLGSIEDVKKFLESGDDAQLVDEEAEEARDEGINGVPNYRIQGVWEVSGAQDPVAFETLFKRWKTREANVQAAKGSKADGNSCL
jgi:predicted DsbA family dithiol-disulfide isomerase